MVARLPRRPHVLPARPSPTRAGYGSRVLRRIALLVNPTAGGGRGSRVAAQVDARLVSAGLDTTTLVGRDRDEAISLAHGAVADAVDGLVVVGGDGTVALALQAVAGTGVALGIIPSGTGNDIARAVGLPSRDPVLAAGAVIDGHVRTIDLARATTADGARWFAGVLATGFDSRVNERANAMHRPRGRSRYHLAMLAELGRLAPLPYDLTLDGVVLHASATLVAVGNGPSYGGGMNIAPGADVADGWLDVTVIGPLTRSRLLRLFPELYPGTFVRHDVVRQMRCRTVVLSLRAEATSEARVRSGARQTTLRGEATSEARVRSGARQTTLRGEATSEARVRSGARHTTSPSGVAYADGERVGPLPVRVEVVPGALRVLAPASAPADS